MPDDTKIDRDVARIGERMAAIETEVRNLGDRFEAHEKADERRHRETIDALGDLRTEVAGLRGRLEVKPTEKLPLMQRDAFGGMNVGDVIRTGGIVLALLGVFAQALRGGEVDPETIDRLARLMQERPAVTAPALPEGEP